MTITMTLDNGPNQCSASTLEGRCPAIEMRAGEGLCLFHNLVPWRDPLGRYAWYARDAADKSMTVSHPPF